MDPNTRNSAIAAATIMLIFGIVAFYIPTIMLAIGKISTVAAGAITILFIVSLFVLFWLRGKSRRGDK
ncbi:hypothetical protein [Pseudaminobacter sp. NGMCC 1.201702]|uniref:hypothetical protein n=1 Tax=Pseudaminobacter sp. NGMCC 1.201702 TaxID=3391825 RepID=UPI0039F04D70